ncbi:hypothetical protein [Motilimonas sp. KMU-193]|uniref:hypothetical protein n=1 Tax=Motilimonas sp. KMU-193 TaxID=3388668 RepID=UPI00396B486A
MVYIWRNPNVPETMVGELVSDLGFGVFQKGVEVSRDTVPVFKFNCKLKKLYDVCQLANSTRVPLVNRDIRDLLSVHSDDLQFIKAVVQCQDGTIEDFSVVNVLSLVNALDKEQSIFDCVPGTQEIMRFNSIKYNEGNFIIARESSYPVHLLVSELLAKKLKSSGCKGLFLPAECI